MPCQVWHCQDPRGLFRRWKFLLHLKTRPVVYSILDTVIHNFDNSAFPVPPSRPPPVPVSLCGISLLWLYFYCLDHTQMYSGITPGIVLRGHFWWGSLGLTWGIKSRSVTYKAIAQPLCYQFCPKVSLSRHICTFFPHSNFTRTVCSTWQMFKGQTKYWLIKTAQSFAIQIHPTGRKVSPFRTYLLYISISLDA